MRKTAPLLFRREQQLSSALSAGSSLGSLSNAVEPPAHFEFTFPQPLDTPNTINNGTKRVVVCLAQDPTAPKTKVQTAPVLSQPAFCPGRVSPNISTGTPGKGGGVGGYATRRSQGNGAIKSRILGEGSSKRTHSAPSCSPGRNPARPARLRHCKACEPNTLGLKYGGGVPARSTAPPTPVHHKDCHDFCLECHDALRPEAPL